MNGRVNVYHFTTSAPENESSTHLKSFSKCGGCGMGSHRVGHDWSDLAATAAAAMLCSHPASGRKSIFLSCWEPLGEDLLPIAFFGDSISWWDNCRHWLYRLHSRSYLPRGSRVQWLTDVRVTYSIISDSWRHCDVSKVWPQGPSSPNLPHSSCMLSHVQLFVIS